MGDLVTLDGSHLPAPTDGVVRANPPKPPKQSPVPPPAPAPGPAPGPAPVVLDDLVDQAYAGKAATDLAAAPVDALKGLSPADAQALASALGIRTVSDLATHRLVRAAVTIARSAGVSTGDGGQ
jgi:hypothetical protein